MLRSTFLIATLTVALGAVASAQVTVNGGYAAVAPPPQPVQSTATELGIPSVPAINTPFAHVGAEGSPQNAPEPSQGTQQAQPTVVEGENPAVQVNPSPSQPLNLGVASTSQNPFVSGPSGDNDKSLGEVARELKQKEQTTNAKAFTNADVEKMNGQSSGGMAGATAANGSNTEWPSNNGVITPPTNSRNQGTIASPSAPAPSATGNSPFSPRRQNENRPPNDKAMPADNAPQANAKPSAERPYALTQNNPANRGIPESNETGNAGANTANDNDRNAQLPKTASRLPLLGILGFFSVSMGLFVRYQRAKETK